MNMSTWNDLWSFLAGISALRDLSGVQVHVLMGIALVLFSIAHTRRLASQMREVSLGVARVQGDVKDLVRQKQHVNEEQALGDLHFHDETERRIESHAIRLDKLEDLEAQRRSLPPVGANLAAGVGVLEKSVKQMAVDQDRAITLLERVVGMVEGVQRSMPKQTLCPGEDQRDCGPPPRDESPREKRFERDPADVTDCQTADEAVEPPLREKVRALAQIRHMAAADRIGPQKMQAVSPEVMADIDARADRELLTLAQGEIKKLKAALDARRDPFEPSMVALCNYMWHHVRRVDGPTYLLTSEDAITVENAHKVAAEALAWLEDYWNQSNQVFSELRKVLGCNEGDSVVAKAQENLKEVTQLHQLFMKVGRALGCVTEVDPGHTRTMVDDVVAKVQALQMNRGSAPTSERGEAGLRAAYDNAVAVAKKQSAQIKELQAKFEKASDAINNLDHKKVVQGLEATVAKIEESRANAWAQLGYIDEMIPDADDTRGRRKVPEAVDAYITELRDRVKALQEPLPHAEAQVEELPVDELVDLRGFYPTTEQPVPQAKTQAKHFPKPMGRDGYNPSCSVDDYDHTEKDGTVVRRAVEVNTSFSPGYPHARGWMPVMLADLKPEDVFRFSDKPRRVFTATGHPLIHNEHTTSIQAKDTPMKDGGRFA